MIRPMEEADHLAEVIPLRPDDGEYGPLMVRDSPRNFCRHRDVVLDAEIQRVFCRTCGSEVPAFKALAIFADDYDRYLRSYQHAQAQSARAQEELANVERELRNAKARLRRATA